MQLSHLVRLASLVSVAAVIGLASGCAADAASTYRAARIGAPAAAVPGLKDVSRSNVWTGHSGPATADGSRRYFVVIGADGNVQAKGFRDDTADLAGHYVRYFLAIRGQDVNKLICLQETLGNPCDNDFESRCQSLVASATTRPEAGDMYLWQLVTLEFLGWPFAVRSNELYPYDELGTLLSWRDFIYKARAGELNGVIAVRGRSIYGRQPQGLLSVEGSPANWNK